MREAIQQRALQPLQYSTTVAPVTKLAAFNERILLDVRYPAGARVTAAAAGCTLASSDILVRDIFIVGIGESYASGDGNPDVAVTFGDRRTMAYKTNEREPLDGYPARGRVIRHSRFRVCTQ